MAIGLETNYKVRLISVASLTTSFGIDSRSQVIFDVTPSFTESRAVDYAPVTPVHMPGSIQVYKNSKSRTFTIGAKFISRTVDEATQNMIYLQTLRGWTLPYFGASSTLSDTNHANRQAYNNSNTNDNLNAAGPRVLTPAERARRARDAVAANGVELLGAPPDVLYLYAYSTDANTAGLASEGRNRPAAYGVNINRVPVVVTNLEITYPDDVDYLPTFSDRTNKIVGSNAEVFPVKMDVSITLAETHSPREFEEFNLKLYKQGILPNF